MRSIILLSASLFFVTIATAQAPQPEDQAAAYTKVLQQRTAKIIAPIGIRDSVTAHKVQDIIIQQYRDLNAIHDGRKAKIKALKAGAEKPDEATIQKIEDSANGQLKKLHDVFLAKLSTLLTPEQVDQVKDGMTYKVFPITYTAYQDMIPSLTSTQKDKIYDWLKEAREQAMDQGSSEDKHKVFGKYKGRINNYLSSQGYDLKKEEKAWQERRRQKRQQDKS